jgi:hypothetical protein
MLPLLAALATEPPPDRAREDAVVLSAVAFSVGSISSLLWYAGASGGLGDCASREGCVKRTDPIAPQLTYYGVMLLVPTIPRMVIGDVRGMAIFGAVQGAILLAGKWADGFGPPGGGTGIGFLFGAVAGTIELASTPYRERAPTITPIVLRDGGGLAWTGVF